MNGYNTRTELNRAALDAEHRELAERAARADAIIASVSIFALVVLLIVQLAERIAA